ncbi:MAG: tetratricopeptide repeat protein, partial [Magnetococcales bacterium]|nr:tetratricopeptide repeat protein [Magnetococcales bacterium]
MSRSHRKGPLPPRHPPVSHYGRLLAEAGRLVADGNYLESARKFAEAARQSPKSVVHRINEGVSYLRAGALDKAEAAFRMALQIEPDHPDLLKNMAMMFMSQHRNEEAIATFQQVLSLDYSANPAEAAALWNNMGVTLRRISRFEAAVDCFRSAIELHSFVDPFKNLAMTLEDLLRSNEARAILNQGLTLFPQSIDLLLQLGSLHLHSGQAEEALALFNQAQQQSPANRAAVLTHQLVALQYADKADAPTIKQVAVAIDQMTGSSWSPTPSHDHDRSPDRPLRIGYLSGDFRHHPVAFLVTPAIQHHDPEQIAAVCYFNHIHEDHWTEQIRASSTLWRQVAWLSDDKLEE